MPETSSLPDQQLQELKEALSEKYSVEEEVGAGGMGVVFRALDIPHDRKVALKVLRPEIAFSVGKERFLREVRIEAGLNHPHILPIYDSGEAGGLLYCVTPFIMGESLAERLKRERQLPCDEALRICREIADALMFAHAHDVIHRDVKPGNILLESGHAVLADFGLAKAMSAVGDEALTRTGFAVGTPAYSSPEQAAADEGLDGRTDLYSLGCVLYEMLAGQPPFVGPSSDSVVRQHMTAEPTSVRILRPAIPEGVEAILDQLLAKSPADRFSAAEELVRVLDSAISGEFPQGKRRPRARVPRWRNYLLPTAVIILLIAVTGSWVIDKFGSSGVVPGDLFDPSDLAVLYFDDLSPDGTLQYVADGLTEALINDLNRVGELSVVSRNGVDPFRGSTAPLDSIAEVLKVGTLIHGSVQPLEDRLRVSIHLVEGISGTDFGRSTFDVPANEFLAAQDSVVQEAAWLLRQRLGEEVRLRRRQAGTSSVEAWALVHRAEREKRRAEDLLPQDDREGALIAFASADSLYALAEEFDPEWVEPISMRGWISYTLARQALADPQEHREALESGLISAERALEVDPNFPPALELRGTINYWIWLRGLSLDPSEDEALLEGARQDLEAAVRIDRSLAGAHATLSSLYYYFGSLTDALVSARAAYDADLYLKDAAIVLRRMFLAAYDNGQFPPARFACSEGRRRFPENYYFWRCQIIDMSLPGGTPNPDEAWRLLAGMVERIPEAQRPLLSRVGQIFVAEVLARSALPDSARNVLMNARVSPEMDPNQALSYVEAHVRTVLGDHDEAVDLLRKIFAGSSEGGGEGADWADHWYWNDLQGHPGFQALVEASR